MGGPLMINQLLVQGVIRVGEKKNMQQWHVPVHEVPHTPGHAGSIPNANQ